SINDTYLVSAGAARWMLRIAPTQRRSDEQFATEIDLLHFLRHQGLHVPQPVPLRDGSAVRMLAAPEGPRQAVLFTYVPGEGYTPTTTNSYRYGQAIAHFHAVADSFPQDRPLWRFEAAELLERPLELLHSWLANWPADRAFLVGLIERLRPILA